MWERAQLGHSPSSSPDIPGSSVRAGWEPKSLQSCWDELHAAPGTVGALFYLCIYPQEGDKQQTLMNLPGLAVLQRYVVVSDILPKLLNLRSTLWLDR